jgi:hypothetical protein
MATFASNPAMTALSGSEIIPGVQGGVDSRTTAGAIAQLADTKGADLASAATTDLGSATGTFVHVTGTTTITSLGTAPQGVRRVVRFAGALTLTHNATSLILPTGASITTAANDTAVFVSEGSGNWRCISYQRATGQPLVAATPADGSVTAAKLASDVAELIRDTIGTALVAGTGITLTVNDPGDTITIASTGGYTDEQAQDAFAALIAAGTHSGISFSYNDAGNAISATVSASGSGDVAGPASATADAVALFNGTTGKIIKDSGVTVASLRSVPQNSKNTDYTLVLGDAGGHLYHPSLDTTARTWTIPANSSVAFPIGTALTFVNDSSAGAITIAITTDTLVLAGNGTTGSRTLASNGVATAIKVTSTRWIISGTGLS